MSEEHDEDLYQGDPRGDGEGKENTLHASRDPGWAPRADGEDERLSGRFSVSVALCTYNGEKYIADQLESILTQTRVPDEIVICDDVSRDGTVEIVRETLRGWDGVLQLVRNPENLGYRKNFEKAVSLCHGDFIFLSDQDDVWLPEKIETLAWTLAETGADLVFHDAELVDLSLAPLLPSFWRVLHFDPAVHGRDIFLRLLANNVVQGSACAFRRELFERAVPFPAEAVHDEWLALVAGLTGEIVPVPRVLMKYRQGNNQIGGIPLTAGQKVKKWICSTRTGTIKHRKEIVRRQLLLVQLEEIAKKFSVNSRTFELLIHYREFLRRKRDLSASWQEYGDFNFSRSQGLREMTKDALAFIFCGK